MDFGPRAYGALLSWGPRQHLWACAWGQRRVGSFAAGAHAELPDGSAPGRCRLRPVTWSPMGLVARNLDEWRSWLAEHHGSASEVWLVFHKKHTGVASIPYKDAIDEALCFGWVDSL